MILYIEGIIVSVWVNRQQTLYIIQTVALGQFEILDDIACICKHIETPISVPHQSNHITSVIFICGNIEVNI